VRATFYVNGHTRGLLSAAGKNGHRSKLSFDKLIHNLEEADYVGLPEAEEAAAAASPRAPVCSSISQAA
jgi:hypothetical protein